jgi:hypothetical protein
MLWFLIAVIVVLLGAVLWWLNRRASEAEDETAYLPGGGRRPTIGAAVWSRIRREQR